MACTEFQDPLRGNPWTVSSILSALVELVLAILLLLQAVIFCLTSVLVKFFGLRPPCFNRGGYSTEQASLHSNFASDHLTEEVSNLGHCALRGGHME
eukprot:c3728_g1_i1 orf=601-891(+)